MLFHRESFGNKNRFFFSRLVHDEQKIEIYAWHVGMSKSCYGQKIPLNAAGDV